MAYQVLVVGAGITGLTAAYRAARAGKRVLLVSDQAAGGAIKSSQVEGFTIEHGAAILVELPDLAKLIDDIGLREKIVYPTTRKFAQGIWLNNAPRFLPRSLGSLLVSPLLAPWYRLTLPLKVFFGALKLPQNKDISIAEVARPFLGERGVRYMLTPALRAAYGQDATAISARVMLRNALAGRSQVKCLELLRARRTRRGFMLRNGNHSLISKMLEEFIKLGGEFKIGKISKIDKDHDGYIAATQSGESYQADGLILSTGSELLENLATPQQPHFPKAIPLAIVHFAIKDGDLDIWRKNINAPLLGILFPQGEVFGAMFPSQLFPHIAPAGQQLAAVYLGGESWRDSKIPDADSIVKLAQSGLQRILPDCSARHLTTTVWERAIPSYPLGADEFDLQLKQLETNTPKLFAPLRERGGPGVGDRVAAASKVGV